MATNSYYNQTGTPAQRSRGLSQPLRAEFSAIQNAFTLIEQTLSLVASDTQFGLIWQGASATDPTQRINGGALQDGDLYFNTTGNILKAFNSTDSLWYGAPTASNVMLKDGGTFTGDVLGTNFSASGNMTAVQFIGSLAGMTGMTAAMVTAALAYTPVNKAGDTMSGQLNGTAIVLTGNLTAADLIQTSDERGKKLWASLDDDVVERFLSLKKIGTYTDKKTGKRTAGAGAQSMVDVLKEFVTRDDNGFLGIRYGQAALTLLHRMGRMIFKRLDAIEKRIAKLEK